MKKTFKKILAVIIALTMIMSQSALFSYALEEDIVESMTVTALSPMIENCDGYWSTCWEDDTEHDYFCYSFWYVNAYYTITLTDGTVVEGNREEIDNYFFENYGDTLGYYSDDTQYEEHWDLGKHTFIVGINDSNDNSIAETECEVEIVESPVESLTVKPLELVENVVGYWETAYNAETDSYVDYFHYYLNFEYTVTLKDGTIINKTDSSSFEYNGNYYSLDWNYSQEENPFTFGKNEIPVFVLGYETTAIVEIVESPVESVTVRPLELIENEDGYWDTKYNEETMTDEDYFCYHLDFDYSVTLKDGTVIESEWSSIEYNGNFYSLDYDYSQYDNPLTLGTHEIPVSILGYETTATVEIIDTPIESITVKPLTLIENSNGYWNERYNEETEEDEQFFYYYLNFDYSVTFKNGTTLELENGSSFEYNGEWYSLDYNYSQYDKPLTLGTNEIPVSVLGYEATVTVEIIDTPIAVITVKPLVIIENTNGYWDTMYNEETDDWDLKYYHYNLDFDYTVTFKDGSVIEVKDNYSFEYNDAWYSLDYDYSQANNPITIGVTEIPASVLGYKTNLTVEIIESPVESITVAPVTIKEFTNGSWDTEWTEDNLNEPYYYYSPVILFDMLDVTATMKDGTTVKCPDGELEYLNEIYYIELTTDQYENHWRVGTNKIELTLLGKTVEADVIITAADNSNFVYDIVDGGVVITTVKDASVKELEIPEKINGMDVIGIVCLATPHITELDIPDNIKFLSPTWLDNCDSLTKLKIGKSVANLSVDMLMCAPALKTIEISEDNPYYKVVDGSVYTKDGKTLVYYPLSKGDTYVIPAGVTNIDILTAYNNYYNSVKVVTDSTSTEFVVKDGITYSKDMTKIYFCDPSKTGTYVMPDSVTSIQEQAFAGSALESVTVSKNVNEIVYAVFADCTSLKSISLPENLKSIGNQSFINCSSLTEINIPDSVEYIGALGFTDCTSLRTVTAGKSLDTVDYAAFIRCSSLENVNLTSLVSLGDNVFEYCSELKTILLPGNLEYIGTHAFFDSGLTEITIPDSVTEMPFGAFYNCSNLEKATLSKNVKELNSTFIGSGISSIVIPEGVIALYDTFRGCENLSSITVPSTVTEVSYNAFSGTPFFENEANFEDGILYINNILVYADESGKTVTVKEGIEKIAENAFWNCENIEKVILPESLRNIDNSAFSYCYKLKEINLPESLEYIGNSAFSDCTSLKNITLPEGIKNIGYAAFYNTGIESLKIPSTVTNLVYRSFGNSALTEIELPDTVISMEGYEFHDTPWYEAQPEGEIYIGKMFYSYKGQLKSDTFAIKDGTLGIAGYVFENQSKLTSVTIPSSVKTIGDGAFNSTSLKSVTIPANVESIGSYAFAGTDIKTINIPANVNEIGTYAFEIDSLEAINVDPANKYYTSIDGVLYNKDCTELIYCPSAKTGTVTIPASVELIHAYAFTYSAVNKVIIENDDVEIGYYAFGETLVYSIYYLNDINAMTLAGGKGSTAQAYAEAHGQPFEVIDTPDIPVTPPENPTEKPTEPPTEKPTDPPTEKPTEKPTERPSTDGPAIDGPAIDGPTEKPTEKPTEAPTQKPVSDKLEVKDDTVKVDNSTKVSTVKSKSSAADIMKAVKNEKVSIVDKDGKAVSGDALVGTGSKIQIKDNSGKVINTYTVCVPTDVDGNGKTTAADARLALRGSAKLDKIEGVYATASDMNGDGKITAADARKILRISAGLEKA